MEKRRLGKTGVELSVVGFAGMVVDHETTEDSARYVSWAVERGINYFDVAPSYGNAEEMLGPALEPYRKDVFLACKTGEREAEGARGELATSLERLKTDYFDLYQMHGLITLEEVGVALGTGGAIDVFEQAKRDGKIRHIGFSAHTEEAAIAAMDRYDFDSVLFPVNWSSWLKHGFGSKIMAKAEGAGVGRLALKALAKRQWESDEEKRWPKCWYSPVDSPEEAELALRFSLSQPITSAVSPSHFELLKWACNAAVNLTPLTEIEEATLKSRADGLNTIFPENRTAG